MACVVADVVRADAAIVPQPARGERLALRACGCLTLAGDDLQRDVEAVPLVEREPDGPRAAASERTHGPVAPENELLGGWGVLRPTTPRGHSLPPPRRLLAGCDSGRPSL